MNFDQANAVLHEARHLRAQVLRQLLARAWTGIKAVFVKTVQPGKTGAGKGGTPAAC